MAPRLYGFRSEQAATTFEDNIPNIVRDTLF